jgi:D-alanine--poly(phosphoribitol) ligase subunit 2
MHLMQDANSVIARLGKIFLEKFHIEVPSPDTDLLATGILDSLQLVELVLQLEQHFDFRISIADIDLEDLRTLTRITRLVEGRTDAADAPAPVTGREATG